MGGTGNFLTATGIGGPQDARIDKQGVTGRHRASSVEAIPIVTVIESATAGTCHPGRLLRATRVCTSVTSGWSFTEGSRRSRKSSAWAVAAFLSRDAGKPQCLGMRGRKR